MIRASKPLISVGLPVYNGEKVLVKAIESILQQSYKNFELIISDNCSTDNTKNICQYYRLKDERIKYFRQKHNTGPFENFKFVLLKSRGTFFTWMSDDDLRSLDFLQANLDFLLENPDFVGATSPNVLDKSNKIYAFDLNGNRVERYKTFFKNGYVAHGLFYSLWRTGLIKRCTWVGERFYGWDWSVVLFMANLGNIGRVDSGLMTFGMNGISSKKNFNVFKFHGLNAIGRFFPLIVFSGKVISLVKKWRLTEFFTILCVLLNLNLRVFLKQIESTCYPTYRKFKDVFTKHLHI